MKRGRILGTRTVRLDDKSEEILEEIRRTTGLSASAALKRGLRALREEVGREATRRPHQIYERLDLGPGGYASASSSEAKSAAKRAIRLKHRR
jgi:Arc/MetJ-type ribon-helix-helix transcriptional regulator